MNVLISYIGSDYMDDWVATLLDGFFINQCIVTGEKEFLNGKVAKKYATCKISGEECKYANYEFTKKHEIPPVDNELLNKMAPYEDTILWLFERRLGRSFMQRWRAYCEHLRVWNYLLDFFHVDLYISLGVPHEGFDYIIYALCQIKKIRFLFTYTAHFLGYSYIANDIYDQIPEFGQYFDSLKKEYANQPIECIVLHRDMDVLFRSYFDKNRDLTPWDVVVRNEETSKSVFDKTRNRLLRFIKNGDIIKKIFDYKTYRNAFIELYNSMECRRFKIIGERFKFLGWSIIHIFSLNLETYGYANFYFYKKDIFREYEILMQYYRDNARLVDYNRKYIYVPLHMQPEATSMPMGGRYADQILMVQTLSYCLPEGYCIYVKEHPGQIWEEREEYPFRTLQFYQKLLEIPHVCLVPFEEDTYSLIKNSRAVASLTGTAGFEAIIYNKLFFMFGYYLTQYAPNALPIRTLHDCVEAMETMQNYQRSEEASKKEVKIYFKALEKFIFKGVHYNDPEIMKVVPDSYWSESKKNLVKRYSQKIVAFFGENVLKK